MSTQQRRHSLRLPGFDYTQAGAYFITICVQDRLLLFGEVIEDAMRLSPAGSMIAATWSELPHFLPGVGIDRFVVMPNHVHAVVVLERHDLLDPSVVPAEPTQDKDEPIAQPGVRLSLPEVVHRFKSLTTARYRQGVGAASWPAFPGSLWQRNYYEHVIRDDDDLRNIRQYIDQNPLRWSLDRENPHRV